MLKTLKLVVIWVLVASAHQRGNNHKMDCTKRERLHAVRDGILQARDWHANERASRPSVAEWYAGRSVFITGGSGFLGRVLIELLLRSCPDIGPIYLLMRSKKGVDPKDRLGVLLDVPLFDRLRAEQPAALSKVRTVPGDIEAPSLGLSDADRQLLCAEVSVVFHVAASVRFDDPLQKALRTNLQSTKDIVQLARDMPRLKVLVHVSTAYSYTNQNPIEEHVYSNTLDWRRALQLAELPAKDQKAIDFLGPKLRGPQPNTYTFTKGLAEHLVQEASRDLPIIIVRPSIVVTSHSDPLPGWIDNLNGAAGIVVANLKGVMRYVNVNLDMALDSVPVDVATKLIVLASWSKGLGLQLSDEQVDVVNATVGTDFGLNFSEAAHLQHKHGVDYKVPYPGSLRPPSLRYEPCPVLYALLHFYHHLVFAFVVDLLARALGQKPRALGLYRKLAIGMQSIAPFMREFTFIMKNQRTLQEMIHPSDLKTLDFLEIYNGRDSEEQMVATMVNQMRGVLLYTLKEEFNVEKNSARLHLGGSCALTTPSWPSYSLGSSLFSTR
ncbi:fatty acyl-CoA reductase 1-like isoform X2 [Thrips palmi]|uniref:Fatty acyl-CoA reductase n=1 Tax=Thrips palmi TaxID=161013 RepID=A0A6P8ZV44_THRPL|nr:fatty acyl-CoA reductase 1-like isoform X2 [Thrips palmi]